MPNDRRERDRRSPWRRQARLPLPLERRTTSHRQDLALALHREPDSQRTGTNAPRAVLHQNAWHPAPPASRRRAAAWTSSQRAAHPQDDGRGASADKAGSRSAAAAASTPSQSATAAAPRSTYPRRCEPSIVTLSMISPNTTLMVHGKFSHAPSAASSAAERVGDCFSGRAWHASPAMISLPPRRHTTSITRQHSTSVRLAYFSRRPSQTIVAIGSTKPISVTTTSSVGSCV